MLLSLHSRCTFKFMYSLWIKPMSKLIHTGLYVVVLLRVYLYGPVEGIQKDLCEGHDLRRAVPAVWAVHQHRTSLPLHRRAHQSGSFQHDGQVLQPTGAFQSREPAGESRRTTRVTNVWTQHHRDTACGGELKITADLRSGSPSRIQVCVCWKIRKHFTWSLIYIWCILKVI